MENCLQDKPVQEAKEDVVTTPTAELNHEQERFVWDSQLMMPDVISTRAKVNILFKEFLLLLLFHLFFPGFSRKYFFSSKVSLFYSNEHIKKVPT